jgi:hypothetical protein
MEGWGDVELVYCYMEAAALIGNFKAANLVDIDNTQQQQQVMTDTLQQQRVFVPGNEFSAPAQAAALYHSAREPVCLPDFWISEASCFGKNNW